MACCRATARRRRATTSTTSRRTAAPSRSRLPTRRLRRCCPATWRQRACSASAWLRLHCSGRPDTLRGMSIHLQLAGHEKDLGGGFTVRRLLPAAQQRSVGPFIFFDHFGPAAEEPKDKHNVRPHPHIGLATVTY